MSCRFKTESPELLCLASYFLFSVLYSSTPESLLRLEILSALSRCELKPCQGYDSSTKQLSQLAKEWDESLQRWGNTSFKSSWEGTACSFHHSTFLLASAACLVAAALSEKEIKIRCTLKCWNQPLKRTDLSVVPLRSSQTLQRRDPFKDRNPRNLWFMFSSVCHTGENLHCESSAQKLCIAMRPKP